VRRRLLVLGLGDPQVGDRHARPHHGDHGLLFE